MISSTGGTAPRGTLFLVAADHPARGALAGGGRPLAMADRRSLLARVRSHHAAVRRARREPGPDPAVDLTRWTTSLRHPAVSALVVGRTLLYPPDGAVAGQVAAAARTLRDATDVLDKEQP